MLTDVLIYALVLVAAFQPTDERYVAASIFAILTLTHNLFLSSLDGLFYYGSAAGIDLFVILLLSSIKPFCELSLKLIKVSVVSIIANSAGWVMWMLYLPPTPYNYFYLVLYSYVLIIMLRQNRVGNHALDSRNSHFHIPHH